MHKITDRQVLDYAQTMRSDPAAQEVIRRLMLRNFKGCVDAVKKATESSDIDTAYEAVMVFVMKQIELDEFFGELLAVVNEAGGSYNE